MSISRPPKPDDVVIYCAEAQKKSDAFSGPFPARVLRVLDGEPPRIDLEVTYAPGVLRTKTGVPFSESPAKHHWSWLPRS